MLVQLINGMNPLLLHELEEPYKEVFGLRVFGDGLGKIADKLEKAGIAPPQGNQSWTRAIISKILSNSKYVPHIISEDQFMKR